jgi:hypothetical protein
VAASGTPPAAGAAGGTKPDAAGAAGGTSSGTKGAEQTLLAGDGKTGDLELKLPEGREFNTALLDGFKSWAKESKVEGPQAQKLLDLVVKESEAAEKEVREIHDGWLKAAKSDKEFGGEKLTENLGVARKAMTKFGGEAFSKFLEETKLGNHPEVIRFLVRVGRGLGEDTVAGTTTNAPPPKKSNGLMSIYDHPTSKKMSGMAEE